MELKHSQEGEKLNVITFYVLLLTGPVLVYYWIRSCECFSRG
jgi:hypothetical protein